jgi:hypothetical protein
MQHTQRWRPRPANTLRASVSALPTHSALVSSPCQHTLSAGVLALPTHSALGRGSTLSVGQRQYAQRWAEAVCERRPADGAGHRLILSGGHNSGLPKVRSSSSLFGPPLFDEHAPCAWCFVSNPPHCISWRSARQSGDLVKLVRSAVLPGPHADVKTRCAASAQQLHEYGRTLLWCYELPSGVATGRSSHAPPSAVDTTTATRLVPAHAGLVAGTKAQLPVDRPQLSGRLFKKRFICLRTLAGMC